MEQKHTTPHTGRAEAEEINAEIISASWRAALAWGGFPSAAGPTLTPKGRANWHPWAPHFSHRPPRLTRRSVRPKPPTDVMGPPSGTGARRVLGRKREGARISFVIIKFWTTLSYLAIVAWAPSMRVGPLPTRANRAAARGCAVRQDLKRLALCLDYTSSQSST
jgi:hypothetical protein